MEGAKIRQAMARLMHGTAVRCLQAGAYTRPLSQLNLSRS
jgi:hypothetical protein